MTEPTWTLGVLVGLPLAGFLALICLAILVIGIVARVKGYADGTPLAAIGGIALLLTVGVTSIVMIPWDAEYHQWKPVAGTVQEIDKRLISEGEGMSERYVLTIDGQPYGVDDTRAATLEVGDDVSLMCKKEWQWAASDGWGCRWGGQ